MISALVSKFHRSFIRKEDGNATVEFVIVFPFYLSVMMMSIELGFVTLRSTLLERGMDMAVRDIRLGTGSLSQDGKVLHDEIKKAVCDNAIFVLDCQNSLRLEMVPTDIRTYANLGGDVQCTDRAETSEPVLKASPGQPNELVLLRACLRYDPLFPKEFLGKRLLADESGQAKIVSTTAFVQEPT